jgi:putative methyltransferase (TIGR04325 family)
VTDFGGHLGVKYHAYRPLLDLPDDLRWQVVDVPAVCREGRRRVGGKGPLTFHEDAKASAPCDVLICSGVLQYVEMPVDTIVDQLPSKPPAILLNKVAVTEGDSFFTLETFGTGRMPYRVASSSELTKARERLGYKLLSRWEIPHRAFTVSAARGRHSVKMIGEAWSACLAILAPILMISTTDAEGVAGLLEAAQQAAMVLS